MPEGLDPEARALIDDIADRGLPPIQGVSIDEGRRLLDDLIVERENPDPVSVETVLDFEIPGPADPFPVRVYRPDGDALPVLVYYHGGAWVRGSLETHDDICRRLAVEADCVVISVDYRQPPEHPFPAPLEDAYAAAEWAVENGEAIKGDPDRVAIGGDSAGGNLAAATALLARERGGPEIAYQALLYPVVNYYGHRRFPSYEENDGVFGSFEDSTRAREQYLRSDVDAYNPFAFPLRADDLSGLAPALMLTCEFDMLRDEDLEYADRLEEAGVPVDRIHVDGMFHPFLNFPELETARRAHRDIAARLRDAFES